MDPLAIHHVSVNVSNASESVDFYTGVLGGTVRDDRTKLGIGDAVTVGSDRQTFVDDPSGNLIELHELALRR